MGTGTEVDNDGPFWVVLGGTEEMTGIWQYQRPPNVALGRFRPLVPIVVIVKTAEDAARVNVLNTEIFARVDPDDYRALKAAISQSPTVSSLFAQYGKLYAFRWAEEPGIYVSFTWPEVEHYKSFSGAKYQGFESFADALLFMIDKEPYKTLGQGPRPPPQRIQPGTQGPPPPPGTMPSVSRGGAQPTIPPFISAFGRVEGQGYAGGSASARASPVKVGSASVAHRDRSPIKTMAGSSFVKTEPRDDIDQLSHFMRLMFDSLPAETRALRSLVGPLPCQDPAASGAPPLTFGQRADALLRERNLSAAEYLTVLQACLYSVNARAFGYALHRELDWVQEDGEELWHWLEIPLL
ncbi:hypothetical protein C8Q76DRAFT_801414 [Earliella scabrosa]|nr:hypothetical protein C8Q76DRAFT_801414 [Earliella scabrosa]